MQLKSILQIIKTKEENWSYFKLLLFHNFDKNVDDNETIWRQIYKIHYENYQAISDLAKIIGMIPSNSCSLERSNNNNHKSKLFEIGFSTKNIIKNKFRNRLKTKTKTVDMLIRI